MAIYERRSIPYVLPFLSDKGPSLASLDIVFRIWAVNQPFIFLVVFVMRHTEHND